MTTKLKPCPFCGGEVRISIENYLNGDFYSFLCDSCSMYTEYQFIDKEEAIEAWNTRKPMDRIVEQLEEQSITWKPSSKEWWKPSSTTISLKKAIEIVKNGGKNE